MPQTGRSLVVLSQEEGSLRSDRSDDARSLMLSTLRRVREANRNRRR
jgi:hypothetical protein